MRQTRSQTVVTRTARTLKQEQSKETVSQWLEKRVILEEVDLNEDSGDLNLDTEDTFEEEEEEEILAQQQHGQHYKFGGDDHDDKEVDDMEWLIQENQQLRKQLEEKEAALKEKDREIDRLKEELGKVGRGGLEEATEDDEMMDGSSPSPPQSLDNQEETVNSTVGNQDEVPPVGKSETPSSPPPSKTNRKTVKTPKTDRKPVKQPVTPFKRTLPLPSTPLPKSSPYHQSNHKRSTSQTHAVDTSKLTLGWYCICSSNFTEQGRLSEHIKYYTLDPKFPCLKCPVRFTTLKGLRDHLRTSHKLNDVFPEGAIGCGNCGQIFNSKEEHKAHRLAEHPRWTQKLRQAEHAKDNTAESQGIYRCICSREFHSLTNLNGHVRGYTNEANFSCDLCPSTFSTFGRLRQHSLRIHKQKIHENKRFGCGLCAELCSNRKTLQQHMLTEHGSITWSSKVGVKKVTHGAVKKVKGLKSFECLCGKKFPEEKQLNRHLKLKEPKVPGVLFKCTYCSGEFRAHSRLSKHIRLTHNKDYKGFGCTVCGTTWGSRTELRRHQDKEHPGLRSGLGPDAILL